MGLFLSALSSLFIFLFLNQFADPPGVNGYFYLKQIKALSLWGDFYFKDHSFAFLLPYVLNLIFSNELLSFRLAIALVVGGIVVVQILWSRILLQGHPEWRLWLGMTLVFSGLWLNPSFFELGVAFYKNATALLLILIAFYFLFQTLEHFSKWNLFWTLSFALMALLTHKSSALLLLLMGLSYLIQKRNWKVLGAILALCLAVVLVFPVIFSQGADYLKYILSNLSFHPKSYWVWSKALRSSHNLIFFALLWNLIFLAFYTLHRKHFRSGQRLVGDFISVLILVVWLPIYPPGEDQLAYRMMILQSVLSLPLMATLLVTYWTQAAFAMGLMGGVLIGQFALSRPLHIQVPRYSFFTLDAMELKNHVTSKDHLICHHGLEFFIDYTTDIRCQIFLSEDPNQKQFRLVYAPPQRQWMMVRKLLLPKALHQLGSTYFLVSEQDWREVVAELGLKSNWRNPMEKRPSHVYAPN